MLIFALALLNQLREECIQKKPAMHPISKPSDERNVVLRRKRCKKLCRGGGSYIIPSDPSSILTSGSLSHFYPRITNKSEVGFSQLQLALPRLFELRFSSSAIGGLSRHRPNCKNGGWARNKRPRLALGGVEKTLITRSVGEGGRTPGCEATA